jgi:hypothetical protein
MSKDEKITKEMEKEKDYLKVKLEGRIEDLGFKVIATGKLAEKLLDWIGRKLYKKEEEK